MEMESISSKNLLFSCWGRLKLKLPWPKRSGAADHRRRSKSAAQSLTANLDCGSSAKSLATSLDCKSIAATLSVAQPKPVGGFRYDPLSYSQNFDAGPGTPTATPPPAASPPATPPVPLPTSSAATLEPPPRAAMRRAPAGASRWSHSRGAFLSCFLSLDLEGM